ncbi:hypothetical protein C8J57DRAFT_1225729 [Mycena rebaudengoi]|nr:hypothetical protein C8J57DRAFT_1225729 [Mycena rebaudengoi]
MPLLCFRSIVEWAVLSEILLGNLPFALLSHSSSASPSVASHVPLRQLNTQSQKLGSTAEATSADAEAESHIFVFRIEWEATPPPESAKGPLDSLASSDALEDKDSTHHVLPEAYITNAVVGARSSSVVVTGDPSASAACYEPAPINQCTLDTRYTRSVLSGRVTVATSSTVFTIPPKEALYFIVAGSSADYGDYVLMHL